MWKKEKMAVSSILPNNLDLTTLKKKALENIVGKGVNAGNQHFLLFPQCFLPFPKLISIFATQLFCRLQMLSIWTSQKICHLVKSLSIFPNESIKRQ